MIWERAKWTMLILWVTAIGVLAVLNGVVPLWFAVLVEAAWVGIFVVWWPEEDEVEHE